MRRIFSAISVAAALFSCAASSPSVQNAGPGKARDLISEFASEYDALKISGLALALADNLSALKSGGGLSEEAAFASKWRRALSGLDRASLPICERIDAEKALQEAAMIGRRAKVASAYQDRSSWAAGLDGSAGAKEFYDLLLDWQLGFDADPDEIFAFGKKQSSRALANYAALQALMGFAGNDAGLAAHQASTQFAESNAAAIQKSFEAASALVASRLDHVFLSDYGVAAPKIERAERGGPLAATPGFYDGDTGVFFYNAPGETYDLRNRGWLYLHEAVPGHHFQISISRSETGCRTGLENLWSGAFVEGWGAYVETLGAALGLYATPEEEMAAVEWDMVRSARVSIDVGLNYYGWTDAEAHDYWRLSVKGQDAIAQREIDRMRRWPAQVVTYKYGAAAFERSRDTMMAALADGFDLRKFHDLALKNGSMPIPLFEAIVAETAEATRQSN